MRATSDLVRLAAAAAAAGWVALLLHGGTEHLGRFSARPVAGAAACGIALLVCASAPVERTAADVVALVVVWLAATLGVTGGVGDPSVIPIALWPGIAAVAVAVAAHLGRGRVLPAAFVVAGAALVVAGVAIAGDAAARFDASAFADSPVGVALAITGAVAVLVGALDPDGYAPLAVPALTVAVVVAPSAGTPGALVVPVGIAAVAAAWFDRRGLAVTLTAIAALASTTPAGLLLAGAAVVVIAVPSSPALLAAMPGAVALVVQATHDPTAASVAAAATVGAVAAFLTLGRDLRPTTIPRRSVPAAFAGVHLALAPAASGMWTGRTDALTHWNRGAAVTVATALLAVVVGMHVNVVPLDPHAETTDAEPPPTTLDPRWARRARDVALLGLGVALVALVRSSLRSVP